MRDVSPQRNMKKIIGIFFFGNFSSGKCKKEFLYLCNRQTNTELAHSGGYNHNFIADWLRLVSWL